MCLHINLKEYFYVTARDMGAISDNLLDYTAGPAAFTIYPHNKNIKVTLSSARCIHMLNDLKKTIIAAWELKDTDIIEEKTSIQDDIPSLTIKLNYRIALLYLSRNIIYYNS